MGTVAAAGACQGPATTWLAWTSTRSASLCSRGGRAPFYEPGLESRVAAGIREGRLGFLHRDEVKEPLGDIAVVATGTPPLDSGAADMRQVRSALAWVKDRGSPGLVVVMKSTVPPGMGRRILAQDLRGLGIRYVSNPEFLREGRAVQDWDSPDRVVIGAEYGDAGSVDLVKRMHSGIDAPQHGNGHHERGDDQVREQRPSRHAHLLHQRDRRPVRPCWRFYRRRQ